MSLLPSFCTLDHTHTPKPPHHHPPPTSPGGSSSGITHSGRGGEQAGGHGSTLGFGGISERRAVGTWRSMPWHQKRGSHRWRLESRCVSPSFLRLLPSALGLHRVVLVPTWGQPAGTASPGGPGPALPLLRLRDGLPGAGAEAAGVWAGGGRCSHPVSQPLGPKAEQWLKKVIF